MRLGLASSIILLTLVLFAGACGKTEKSDGTLRLVVLSPEVAEIISALGAQANIVAITEECNYPSELQKLPKVGKFGSVKRELIFSLKPDLVFTSGLEQDALSQELEKLGLRVEQVYPRTLTDLSIAIKRIGTLINRESEANAMADSIENTISLFKKRTSGKPKPKVYLEIYRDPLMSVADASFVGELIDAAGGDNIFSSLERDYARVSAEDIVAAKPDIIICYSQDTLESIMSRKGWQDIPAIRNKRIFLEKDINPDWVLRASPRIVLGLQRLNEIFQIK